MPKLLPSLLLLLSAPAYALVGGAAMDAENSGFLSIRAGGKACTGVMISEDTFITSSHCFVDEELMHPEMLGWFMGSQDSDENPIRELRSDDVRNQYARVTVGRLTHPVKLNQTPKAINRAPLDRLGPGTALDCVSYGQLLNDGLPLYGNTLGRAPYTVTSLNTSGAVWSWRMGIRGAVLNGFDVGAACFDRARPDEVAALVVDVDLVIPLSRHRQFVTEFITDFELIAEHSGLCLDVPDGSHANGRQLQQLGCNQAANQHFRFKRASPMGSDPRVDVRLMEIRSAESNKCLSVPSASLADRAPVIQWTCSGDPTSPLSLPSRLLPDQSWILEDIGGGLHLVRNEATNKCLDVREADTHDGAVLIQYRCNPNSPNQQWRINAAAFSRDPRVIENENRCVGVLDSSQAENARVVGSTCSGGLDQQWRIDAVPQHFMAVLSAVTGFDMALTGRAALSGRLFQFPWNVTFDQQWRFEWGLTGYRVHSRIDDDQCLNLARDGTLRQRRCSDSSGENHQEWLVK